MAKLTPREKERLEAVLEVAGDMESRIPEGIRKALNDLSGPQYAGNRKYLWHLLEKKARGKIRRARENAHHHAVLA